MSKTFKQYKDEQSEHEAWLKNYEKVISKRKPTVDLTQMANDLFKTIASVNTAKPEKK